MNLSLKSQNIEECGRKTILLVEDEPAVRRASQMLLERSGYRVLAAEDGVQAVEIFEGNTDLIDLLLTDVVMPKMGGFEAARRIQEIKWVPVLFCSGYAAETLRAESQIPPEARILVKPYSPVELREIVREMLNGQNAP